VGVRVGVRVGWEVEERGVALVVEVLGEEVGD
jgi:hypothetical protein